MTEPDMTSVHPLRLAETRKRIAVLEEFLQIERPDRQTRERFAATLGLTERYFTKVAKAWRIARQSGNVAALGATTGGKGGRKPRRATLSVETIKVTRDAITAIGSEAPLRELRSRVEALCRERGLTPPSRTSIWNIQAAARAEGGASGLPSSIVTGNVVARLPVVLGGELTLPILTVRVAAPSGLILSHTVSFTTGGAATSGRSLDTARRPHSSDTRPPAGPGASGRVLASLLGRDIGGLEVVHNQALSLPAVRLLRSQRDAPVSREEALRLVFDAVARHNERRVMLPAEGRPS